MYFLKKRQKILARSMFLKKGPKNFEKKNYFLESGTVN